MNDILRDENGDISIVDGDIVIGFSDLQHQKNIIKTSKGSWKEFPEVGVGIEQYLSDDEFDAFLIETKKQLQYDGMKINNITFTETGNLNIDGKYKDNG